MWWIPVAARAEDPAPEPAPVAVEAEEEPIEEMVVTGTRSEHALGDSPIATEVIDRATIDRSGATSAADLLERVPGVQFTRGVFGAGIALQGLDPTQTLVLVDGQRMIGRKDGTLDLARISADRIERIEIVKGPGSTLYGSDAMGGVINIITRDPKAPRFSGDVRTGYTPGDENAPGRTLDASGLYEAVVGDLRSASSVGIHFADPYDLRPSDPATDGVGLDQLDLAQKFTADASDDVDLLASISYLTRGTVGIESTRDIAQFERINRVEEVQAQLGQTIVTSEKGKLAFNEYYTLFRDQFYYNQIFDNQEDDYEDNRQSLGELDLLYSHVLGRHTTSVGTEAFVEHYESPRVIAVGADQYRQRVGVYLQDEWMVVPDKLELLPGVRFDWDSLFGPASISIHRELPAIPGPTPRLAAAWFANEDLVVRGSYGFGYRAPSFKELYLLFENPAVGYVINGNPDLKPERSRGATLGAEYSPGDFHLAGTLFRNDLDDMIIEDIDDSGGFSATQRYVYQNIKRAYTMGVDAGISWKPVDTVSLRFGGQYLTTEDKDAASELQKLGYTSDVVNEFDKLVGRPPVSLTYGVVLQDPGTGLGFTADGTYTGKRVFYDQTDDGELFRADSAPLALVDARGSWRLRSGTEVYAGVENLLDEGDPDRNQMKPRWFYVGFRLAASARSRSPAIDPSLLTP